MVANAIAVDIRKFNSQGKVGISKDYNLAERIEVVPANIKFLVKDVLLEA